MVDAVTAIITSVIAGLAGGFLHSWMAFNASGEKYDPRKHGNALIVGALSGMGLGLILVVIAMNENTEKELTAGVLAAGLFFIFLAAAGVDAFRSKASKMIAQRTTKPVDEPTPTPAPTTTETPKST
jgi:H+/Cl- antiporter ClcA